MDINKSAIKSTVTCWVGVEKKDLAELQQARLDIIVDGQTAGVDNTHVQSCSGQRKEVNETGEQQRVGINEHCYRRMEMIGVLYRLAS